MISSAPPDSVNFPHGWRHSPFLSSFANEEYAIQIARDWNTKDAASGYVGYVLRFSVPTEFLNRYEIHTVGDSLYREYWILALDLHCFNENIAGNVEVLSELRAGNPSPA